jgi:hypothetical protein
MRVIWWSYGVDLTDNKSGPAKQETQHMPRAIAPKAMYLRNENGGRLTRIIVLMIPISIGYATDAFPPAPTIRELTPRGLDQHWRGTGFLGTLAMILTSNHHQNEPNCDAREPLQTERRFHFSEERT